MVTEGLVIRDVERTFDQLEQVRALGIQVLTDDFGAGNQSLSYFQRFPFDKVKLDKSFVDDIETLRAAKAIVLYYAGSVRISTRLAHNTSSSAAAAAAHRPSTPQRWKLSAPATAPPTRLDHKSR